MRPCYPTAKIGIRMETDRTQPLMGVAVHASDIHESVQRPAKGGAIVEHILCAPYGDPVNGYAKDFPSEDIPTITPALPATDCRDRNGTADSDVSHDPESAHVDISS
jgi:hypothetical protein